MASQHWEREGIPPYYANLEKSSMQGDNIENDPQAWEATEGPLTIKLAKLVKIVQEILDEAEKVMDMNKYQLTFINEHLAAF